MSGIERQPALPRWLLPVAVLGLVAYLLLLFAAERRSLGAVTLPSLGVTVAVLALSLLNYALRFLRWQAMLRALGHAMPSRWHLLVYVAGFAFTVTPGKAGEGVRAFYLRQRGVPVAASLAALFVERLLDLSAVALLALLLVVEATGYRWLLLAGGLMTALLFALMVHPALPRLSRRLAAGRSGGMARLLATLAAMFDSARALLGPRHLLPGLLLGLLAWGAEGYGLLLLLDSFASSRGIGMFYAIGAYALSLIAGVVSFLPGGVGGAEAALVALLSAKGLTLSAAIAATVLCRLATLWFAVVLGLLAMGLLHRQPILAGAESS